jgi:hypothetical protein
VSALLQVVQMMGMLSMRAPWARRRWSRASRSESAGLHQGVAEGAAIDGAAVAAGEGAVAQAAGFAHPGGGEAAGFRGVEQGVEAAGLDPGGDAGGVAQAQDGQAGADEAGGQVVDGGVAHGGGQDALAAGDGAGDDLHQSAGLAGAGGAVDEGEAVGVEGFLDGGALGGVEAGVAGGGQGVEVTGAQEDRRAFAIEQGTQAAHVFAGAGVAKAADGAVAHGKNRLWIIEIDVEGAAEQALGGFAVHQDADAVAAHAVGGGADGFGAVGVVPPQAQGRAGADAQLARGAAQPQAGAVAGGGFVVVDFDALEGVPPRDALGQGGVAAGGHAAGGDGGTLGGPEAAQADEEVGEVHGAHDGRERGRRQCNDRAPL